jgi:hypothetical protein
MINQSPAAFVELLPRSPLGLYVAVEAASYHYCFSFLHSHHHSTQACQGGVGFDRDEGNTKGHRKDTGACSPVAG